MFGLDAFQTYLIIANVISFIAFTVDYFYYVNTGNELMNHAVMCLFAVAGGPIGMLVAFLVWDRHVKKANVAWRFVAIILIVVWVLIVANVYGWVRFDFGGLADSFGRNHSLLLAYLIGINIVTFVVFCVDKAKAVAGSFRISEFALLGLSLLGGSIGGMLGMFIAHHKTSKYYFKYGLPIMLVLQVIVIAYLMQAGIA